MNDQPKRMIVDGVEFSQLFQFPRLLAATVWAMQPGRLIIGLLIVLTLATFGGIWDSSTAATVHPAGLKAGRHGERESAAARLVYTGALNRYAPDSDVATRAADSDVAMRAADVIEAVLAGYRSGLDGLPEDERAARRDALITSLERIDSVRPRGTFEATVEHARSSLVRIIGGVLQLSPRDTWGGLGDLIVATPVHLWTDHRGFAIAFGLLFVLLWSVGGGALSRMAATRAGGQERLSVASAFDFAFRRWVRLVLTTVLPLVIAGLLAAIIAAAGWLMMLPGLDVLGGLAYGLALIAALAVVFLVVGYAASFLMLVPAVACEDCDAADAQQRAFAYVLSRPLHLVGYVVVGLIGISIGYVVVAGIAVLVLNVTGALIGSLSGNQALVIAGGFDLDHLSQTGTGPVAAATIDAWHSRWAAGAISLWQTVVTCLVVGYVVSYVFSASTMLYLLMRRACDGQSTDEIWYPGYVGGTFVPADPAPASDAAEE